MAGRETLKSGPGLSVRFERPQQIFGDDEWWLADRLFPRGRLDPRLVQRHRLADVLEQDPVGGKLAGVGDFPETHGVVFHSAEESVRVGQEIALPESKCCMLFE